jgi:hypothetical protein
VLLILLLAWQTALDSKIGRRELVISPDPSIAAEHFGPLLARHLKGTASKTITHG